MAGEAVIVIDMLVGFLQEDHPLYCGAESRKIIPRVVELLRQKEQEGAMIIYAADSHDPKDREFEMFPAHCVTGSEESKIIEELVQFKGQVVPKTTFSAFFRTDMEKILKDLAPVRVTVVGVCTDICVMYTVFELRCRGYPVEVPEDCVASFDDKAHRFALEHMEKILGATIV